MPPPPDSSTNARPEPCPTPAEMTRDQREREDTSDMGTDAARWADHFTRLHGGDWGLMVGWFANAIEQGRSAGYEQGKQAGRDEWMRPLGGSATPPPA